MNESVRTMAVNNINLRTRTMDAELLLMKSDFEEAVVDRLVTGRSELDEEDTYTFDYLDNESGAVKAIRLKVLTKDGRAYQTTVQVDVADG